MTTPRKTPARAPVQRASRTDGAATRELLLETAGKVFGERGYADTTSKEICERAGTPLAAVNYYFGSREALYEIVLVEAHRHLIGLDELAHMTTARGSARQRLRTFFGYLAALAASKDTPWGFRVVLREVLSPSPSNPVLIEKAIRPKAKLLFGLLAEYLELPVEHPAIQRAVVFSLLPCVAMMVVPRQMSSRLLPAAAKEGEALVEDFVNYVMAGLQSLARTHRLAGTS